jgi:hypothetical protein
MISRYALQVAAFGLFLGLAALPIAQATAPAPPPVKPAISEEAGSAVSRMGKALLAKDLSFTAKTIRVYLDESGQPLHIFQIILPARFARLRHSGLDNWTMPRRSSRCNCSWRRLVSPFARLLSSQPPH